MQAFDADLLVADPGNLGGWALADALDIHKAIVQVPGFTPPLVRHVLTLHHGLSDSPCSYSLQGMHSQVISLNACQINRLWLKLLHKSLQLKF